MLNKALLAALSAISLLWQSPFVVANLPETSDFESKTLSRGDKPNIVIVVTDDQRWDQLGVVQREQGKDARFPFLTTPRLDALAEQGVRFRNAFVTTSLCSPSRAAILTGKYNHANGVINNRTPFPEQDTWATALSEVGYDTVYVGKWHHGRQWERPGFNYTATYAGQGRYFDQAYRINGKSTKSEGYTDQTSVEFAIQYMEQQTEKPFAMMIGLKAPHQPFEPMPEHANLYADATITPPQNLDAIPPWSTLRYPKLPRTGPASKWWRNITRSINGIDQNVGLLLDALDRLGLEENTLVIFTSDNGYALREHRNGDKRTAYEESMRVPMIARLPGVLPRGKLSDELVLNIDIAPTVMSLAGVSVPDDVHGRSFLALAQGEETAWRDGFLYQYWQETFLRSTAKWPSMLGLRTDTHKLVTYPEHENWTQLFDLRNDPFETQNLAGYASHAVLMRSLCKQMEEMAQEVGYTYKPTLNKWLTGIMPKSTQYTPFRYAQRKADCTALSDRLTVAISN
ncbi:MAG: sulfatase-like hydrolase/transferase [Pseudomonadales bacterium]